MGISGNRHFTICGLLLAAHLHIGVITAAELAQGSPETPTHGQLERVGEALEVIKREYMDPVEDARLIAGCRERMLSQAAERSNSQQQIPGGSSAGASALEQIADTFNAIKQQYREAAEDKRLVDACLQGMVGALEEPSGRVQSKFLDEEAVSELGVGSGPIGTVGIELRIDDGLVKIVSAAEGGPAEKANLRRDDILEKIDGAPTKGLSLEDVVKRLRGQPGSAVALTIARQGAPAPLEITMIREIIRLESVKWRLVAPGYAYIRISQFREETVERLATALQSSYRDNRSPLQGVILDLRNNPGGLLTTCSGVAAAFLPANALVTYTKGRSKDSFLRLDAHPSNYARRRGTLDLLKSLPSSIKFAPIVVLVNGKSAACSEIVAAVLQDHKRATILGARTFGRGTVQTMFPLRGSTGLLNTALKLSTARFFRPNGAPIESTGVTPDVIVEDTGSALPPFDSGEDALLSQALEMLKSRSR